MDAARTEEERAEELEAERQMRLIVATGLMMLLAGLIFLVAARIAARLLLPFGGVGAAFVAIGVWWLSIAYRRALDAARQVDRRYLREFAPGLVVYALVVIVSAPLIEDVANAGVRALLALLAVVPLVFVVRALVRRMRDGDELTQRVFLEASALAGLAVGVISYAVGFLEAAGLLHLRAGMLYVFPALIGAWGLALVRTRARYRDE